MFLFDFRHTGGRTRYLILGNRSGPEHIIIATYIYICIIKHTRRKVCGGVVLNPRKRARRYEINSYKYLAHPTCKLGCPPPRHRYTRARLFYYDYFFFIYTFIRVPTFLFTGRFLYVYKYVLRVQ